MWHLPQFSGPRESLAMNSWRLWQAWHEPLEPSGFKRPTPLFGQVVGSITGRPLSARATAPFASRLNLTMLP